MMGVDRAGVSSAKAQRQAFGRARGIHVFAT